MPATLSTYLHVLGPFLCLSAMRKTPRCVSSPSSAPKKPATALPWRCVGRVRRMAAQLLFRHAHGPQLRQQGRQTSGQRAPLRRQHQVDVRHALRPSPHGTAGDELHLLQAIGLLRRSLDHLNQLQGLVQGYPLLEVLHVLQAQPLRPAELQLILTCSEIFQAATTSLEPPGRSRTPCPT